MAAPIYSAADYVTRLQALLPPGRAWTRDQAAVLTQVLQGFASTFATANSDANALLTDAFPATAVNLLTEWEESLGLPGLFGVAPGTTSGRQAAVVAALTNTGGQSKDYLIGLAAALGFTITITEFKPWGVDQGVDTLIYGEQAAYIFIVNAPLSIATSYVPGPDIDIVQATPGTGNQQLEAMLSAAKPAQTICVTSYT